MKRVVALALIFSGCASQPLSHVHTLRLANANVVDPAARTIRLVDLVIRDGRIVADVDGQSADETLDLKGRWVMPGLADLHVHSWGNAAPDDKRDEDLGTEAVSRLVLQAGVTTLLDLGGPESEILPLRDKLRAMSPGVHADLFAAGPVFVQGRRARKGGPRIVRNARDARVQVSQLAAKRPDVIKIIYDHSGGSSSMSRAVMRAIVEQAHKLGLKTVVHIGTWKDAREATLAGADVITHLYDDEPIPADLPALMKKQGTASMPTMAVQCDFANAVSGPRFWSPRLLTVVTTPALRAAYADRAAFDDHARFWLEWQTDYCIKNDFPSLRALAKAGVTLLAGSDSGNIGTFQGYSIHRELQLMVEAGVSPWQALASATTEAGRFLGQHYGVQPGDVANLLVLKASPIPNIQNTLEIERVILRGRPLH